MKKFFSALLLALVLLSPSIFAQQLAFPASASTAPSVTFAEKVSISGVHNAGKVSEHLFRGAQPDVTNLAALKKLGITTIIDLRSESSHTRDLERGRAEALGIHFISIPVGGFSNPSSAQLAQFFSLLRQTPTENVFVHCRFGQDRTGVFIAAYRIAFEHWTAEQALAEMDAFGFRHYWHPSMSTFVRAFPERLQTDTVLKSSLVN